MSRSRAILNDIAADHMKRSHVVEQMYERLNMDPTGCWLWEGAKSGIGHGVIKIAGECMRTHRVVYALAHGKAPADDAVIRHRCPGGPNASCLNPAHLDIGTHNDNVQDALRDGRRPHFPIDLRIIDYLVPRVGGKSGEKKRIAKKLGITYRCLLSKIARRRAELEVSPRNGTKEN